MFVRTKKRPGLARDFIVPHHIRKKMAGELMNDQMITMLNEKDIKITIIPGGVIINGSAVEVLDVPAMNSVIHAIEKVLVPPGGLGPAFYESC